MPGPADYIQQGFGQFGQLVQDVGEKSRQPHPALRRRIMDMLERGKDPRQAAVEAKLEMAGHLPGDGLEEAPDMSAPGYAPPPPQMEPYGDSSVPSPRPAFQPMMSQPSMGPPPPAQEQPFTMRDAEDAKNLGLLHDPRALTDTPEDRYARALLRATTTQSEGALNRESRESQTTERVTAQKDIADAGIKEKQRQFDVHHKLEVDKLEEDWNKAVLRARTAIQNAREGRGTAKDVAALKAVLGYDSALQAQISGLAKASNNLGWQGGISPDLQKRLEALQSQHSALAPQVQDALKKAEQIMRSGGGQATSDKSSISLPGKMPDTSVPPGVGQMDMVPVIAPNGQRGKIPKASLQEALKRGYKLQ